MENAARALPRLCRRALPQLELSLPAVAATAATESGSAATVAKKNYHKPSPETQ
jgi:hypothetical protein